MQEQAISNLTDEIFGTRCEEDNEEENDTNYELKRNYQNILMSYSYPKFDDGDEYEYDEEVEKIK